MAFYGRLSKTQTYKCHKVVHDGIQVKYKYKTRILRQIYSRHCIPNSSESADF